MKRGPDRDLYSIIGVESGSSAEEIRAAYLARARVLHPDRFDQQRQSQDWKHANDMMAELNEAYVILRNPVSRAEHDQSWAAGQQRQETPPLPACEFDELSSGRVSFAGLPEGVQSRLIRRQNNAGIEQFQIKLDSVARNFVFMAALLCWFWWLFDDAAAGGRWKGDSLLWRCGLTLAVGFMIGLNLVKIRRWMRSTLTSCFYVTPLYFIKTEYDSVSFRPIWMLKDVAVSRHRRIGPYRGSSVVFKFLDGHDESVPLSSRWGIEILFERLRQYDARLRVAFANHDEDYLRNNDDFFQVQKIEDSTGDVLPWWWRALTHMAALTLCGIGFCGAVAVNEGLSREQWVSHPIGRIMETLAQDQNIPQFISATARSILQNTSEAARIALILALFFAAGLVGARIAGRDRTGENLGCRDGAEHGLEDGVVSDDESGQDDS